MVPWCGARRSRGRLGRATAAWRGCRAVRACWRWLAAASGCWTSYWSWSCSAVAWACWGWNCSARRGGRLAAGVAGHGRRGQLAGWRGQGAGAGVERVGVAAGERAASGGTPPTAASTAAAAAAAAASTTAAVLRGCIRLLRHLQPGRRPGRAIKIHRQGTPAAKLVPIPGGALRCVGTGRSRGRGGAVLGQGKEGRRRRGRRLGRQGWRGCGRLAAGRNDADVAGHRQAKHVHGRNKGVVQDLAGDFQGLQSLQGQDARRLRHRHDRPAPVAQPAPAGAAQGHQPGLEQTDVRIQKPQGNAPEQALHGRTILGKWVGTTGIVDSGRHSLI